MREPLYARIARELAQNIASGKYATGALLPPELELCQSYKASRHTIRAALRELTDLGLVSRRKGIGTRVEEKREGPGKEHPLAVFEDLIALATTNLRAVKKIDEIVADRELAKTIGCAPGSRWAHIASIREDASNKEAPICVTDSYFDPAYTEVKRLVRRDPFALISDLIEEQYGRRSVEVRQTITAVAVSDRDAKILNVEPGSPALRIVRRYIDRNGQTFETTVSVHPAERYACSIVLKRARTGRDQASGISGQKTDVR